MFYRILATLALSFVFYIGSGQISYHRLYETSLDDQMGMADTIFYHMSSTTTSGDVYAMGTKRVGNDDLTIIFTKHSDKGNIVWSKELDLGQDTVDLQGVGNFEFNGTLDSILFVIDAEINGVRKEIFGKLAASGNEIDLKTVGGNQFATFNNIPNVAPFYNQSDLLLTPGDRPTISRVGLGDDLIWSRTYEFTNTDGDPVQNFVTDIKSTADSTIVLVGTTQGEQAFMVAELDSNGIQIWAESYTFSTSDLTRILPTSVAPLTDGNFAIVGDYVTNGTLTNGFVAVVDTLGSVLMAKKIFVTENFSSIRNLTEAADLTLWMSGVYANGDTTKYFTTNMDISGIINWTTIYGDEQCVSDYFTTSLLDVQSTGGASLVGNGFIDDLQVLQVMKHDVDGTTPCSDTLTIMTEDLTVTEDTLTSSAINGGIFFDSLDFELNTFIGFTPPILSIIDQYPPFCPNEVIDTLLIASVSGVDDENISYLWSTGEFTDTIRVMMEGMYSVTVTITEDVCYTMCDTIELTRLTLPTIAITQDNSRFCEEKIIVLTGNYVAGAQGETYLWNTMETTQTIEVTEPGVYSVTVTDDCGEMASDDMEVSLPVFDPSVFFGFNVEEFCISGSATVTAAYTGGGNEPEFIWSNDQTGNIITVTTPGTYTVSVTDECGFNATFTDEIVFPEIATEANITVDPNCDEENPQASTVTFEATGTGIGELQLLTYTVNTNGSLTLLDESNPAIGLNLFNATEPTVNNFFVIATNICGEVLDSLSINATAICSPIDFPIAFFPGGEDEASKTFGPIPFDTLDIERITNIDFKVFNRWGETVFESEAILEAWDGTHKGEPAPSEVYIWYLSFMIDGRQMLEKGDVTLLR